MSLARFGALTVGFESLRREPVRTALSTIGIVMGVASLVAVLSLGDGMERFAREEARETTDLLAIEVSGIQERQVDGIVVPVAEPVNLSLADRRDLLGRLPPGSEVRLFRAGATMVGSPRLDRLRAARVTGWSGAKVAVTAGRSLEPADDSAAAAVVVINPALAAALGSPAPLGDSIQVGSVWARIVGVGGPALGETFDLQVPFRFLDGMLAASVRERLASMVVLAPTIELTNPIKDTIAAWRDAHGPAWKEGVRIRNNAGRLAQVERGVLLFKLLMGAITGVSLLVGGVGIMNVLLASVAERTREIGIRKATGARRSDVMWQFLAESVAIAVAGAVAGVLLGLAIAYLSTSVMRSMTSAQIFAATSAGTVLFAAFASIV
ncbi:MAG: ABC transporter permease, partial [Gemmatimonadales bacterium]